MVPSAVTAAVPAAALPAANVFAETILNGSMLLAIPVAALAGLVSFLSPCVLPLVPGYLGYVTGLTGVDLQKQRRGRMLAGIGLFVLGFSAVFVIIGAGVGQLGGWLRGSDQAWIPQVLGAAIILLGIVFMGGLSWFQRDRKIAARPPAGLWGAPLLGITFGLGWAPCLGPTLSAVQLLSFSGDDATAAKGAFLTFIYCLGLGLPFLLIALGFRRGMGALGVFRRHRLALQRFGGGMLIVLGVLMLTGVWNIWINNLQGWLDSVTLPI
ncbi:cytochrome c biogenesis CcdA family protein [Arthrobacter sp. zg-Y820]|uniref:cytochrome c biogenesis CcdA family protein n=1 Tax=unclassified Arthrobacter TaxID=235627 RepID=UPI001E2FC24C|nr:MULTISPECIES: cytochrome c biogenesis CcdA family protein [unclassified Arthrobacter]MCC9195600.1 cytochrome c biogenesis CcdA family protein [Arthrobacter sp. zg-Y820]MDK1278459.1 cytochrome c biogenesis CcdA family protein [Arthrobacter sp. zg.Y820]MDK1359936.1 cytochrome c biogenesis CcdA family protein [Arthrobacter sp. zg-Y1219]WIB09103.1 cytochrome c biogenesis CcdA family protein [Arthrobacter sp. zg-Y820]